MMTQADILGDVRGSAQFFSGAVVDSRSQRADDPALNAYQMEEDVRIFKAALKAKSWASSLGNISSSQKSSQEWRRIRNRWNQLRLQAQKFLSPSDPLLIHTHRIFQKWERHAERNMNEAIDGWLDYEAEFLDLIVRRQATLPTVQMNLSPQEEPSTAVVGIYHLPDNAKKLRERLTQEAPRTAADFDHLWGQFFQMSQSLLGIKEPTEETT